MPKGKPKDDLTGILAEIRKEHGEESIIVLGDTPLAEVEVIPTGSIVLDEALGVGGFPRGRIVEIYGPESSGKTSIALHAMGIAQRMGLRVAFIDAEHALDPVWATTLGVDTESLVVSQPDTGEQGLSIAEKLAASGKVGIIVIDSVAALVPKAEINGDMGDSHIGLQARLMSQALRKITGVASNTKTTVIFINQLREKVGVFFGNPEVTTGGKALKFYASVRLDVRRVSTLTDGTTPYGNRVRVKVVKNKVARPHQVAEFDFLYSEGISAEAEIIDLGVERGVLRKSGTWYFFGQDQIAQGKEKTRKVLKEDSGLRVKVETAIRAAEPVKPVAVAPKGASEGLASLEVTGAAPWDAAEEKLPLVASV
jgi:recombination protein RecA